MALFNTLKFIIQHPLNRGQALPSVLKFLRWQVGSRLVPGAVIVTWVNGARIIVRPGETGLTGNIYCGLHEFPEMGYLLHVLNAEDLFIDIGANVGSYTVLACAAKGAKGYCFEPVPATFTRLLDNLNLNNLSSRVVALNLGLSDTEGELVFTASENCTNHVVAPDEPSTERIRVKVLPLDSIIPNENPSVLKIDVEGFETRVIGGAHATLSNPSLHSVIMELNGSGLRYGFDEAELFNIMNNYGFVPYSYAPLTRELMALAGQNRLSGNVLFVRNIEQVREQIQRCPKILVGSHWL